jgi:hypothetical protein
MVRKRSNGKAIFTRCCSCQKIRNDTGGWQDEKEFRLDLNKTLFSHSVCPVCLGKLYPEYRFRIGANL